MKKVWEEGEVLSDREREGQSRDKQRVRYCKGLVHEPEAARTWI